MFAFFIAHYLHVLNIFSYICGINLNSMKRTFTKEYIMSERGCYDRYEVNNLPFINNNRITLKTLFEGLPIKDFTWFLFRKCALTSKQKRQFAVHCAKQVVPIYEKNYPKDGRVRECIEATEQFINSDISRDELIVKVNAAYAAAAYDADAYAAYAAAAYAAAADRESIWEFCKTLK